MKKMLLLIIVLLSLGCDNETKTMRTVMEAKSDIAMTKFHGEKTTCEVQDTLRITDGWYGKLVCNNTKGTVSADIKVYDDYTFTYYENTLKAVAR